jgi:hypothetical protein
LSVLRNFERRIGGLFEGVFNRTFRSAVQPVELARKLAKEMDEHKTISIHRVYVPDEYTIYLNPADRDQFAAYETQMRTELAEYLVEHARREGYSLPSRPLVLIETEPELTIGTFGIAVATQDGDGAEPMGAAPAAAAAAPVPAPAPAVAAPDPPPPVVPTPAITPPPADTMIYQPPSAEQDEVATLTWNGSAQEISQRVTVIGRSSECDVPLTSDPNVSRRHAEVRRIGDGYSLVDLGSTNGTEVNGQRIQETALMNGDVIGVGTTSITFERRLG